MCGEVKPLTDYYIHYSKSDLRQSCCKECQRNKRREELAKTKIKKPTTWEFKMRDDENNIKYKVETGGTASGGRTFVVLDTNKLKTADELSQLCKSEYIDEQSDKLFQFIIDNVPVRVFERFVERINKYNMKVRKLDMNKFNNKMELN